MFERVVFKLVTIVYDAEDDLGDREGECVGEYVGKCVEVRIRVC